MDEPYLKTYDLKPEDLEDGPDGEKTMVTNKAIREYIAITVNDEYWDQSDTDRLIIEDNKWYSPQTFGSFGGEWHIDGPIIQITIDPEDRRIMQQHEVSDAKDAAFYLANEVVNEYHSFDVVQRADIGGANVMYIRINQWWYKFEAKKVMDPKIVMKLEELAE